MTPRHIVQSLDDVEICDMADLNSGKTWSVSSYITDDDMVYTGHSDKLRKDMTLDQVNSVLIRCPGSALYPTVPENIIIAPENEEEIGYLKRPPLLDYVPGEIDPGISKQGLDETLIMETVSKLKHPNIVQYLGARVRRGLLTGFYMEKLPISLLEYCDTPAFKELDKDVLYVAVESAIRALHSIGLAYNDIYPGNIMIKDDGSPVLIDFGSCRRVGEELRSCGSPGWFKEDFSTSEIEHDEYSLGVLKKFL